MRLSEKLDAQAFAALEDQVFERPWSQADFVSSAETLVFSLWQEQTCAAFIFATRLLDEAELWRIACLPQYHRQGLGRILMGHLVQACREREVVRLFLEVSAHNHTALAFYRKLAFQEDGRRINYYGSGEDALLLSLSLMSGAADKAK